MFLAAAEGARREMQVLQGNLTWRGPRVRAGRGDTEGRGIRKDRRRKGAGLGTILPVGH